MNQNPVLKKARVVDAGGKGFLVILSDAFLPVGGGHGRVGGAAQEIAIRPGHHLRLRYPMLCAKGPGCGVEALRDYLNSIGDSLVIGEDDESFKVHVHTNIPGEALTESQKYGTLELG